MDYAAPQIAHSETTVNAPDSEFRELNDLQLAIVGGATGEVVFV
jgi:hypothetical protein